jgi:hypothetical protein
MLACGAQQATTIVDDLRILLLHPCPVEDLTKGAARVSGPERARKFCTAAGVVLNKVSNALGVGLTKALGPEVFETVKELGKVGVHGLLQRLTTPHKLQGRGAIGKPQP